MKKRTKISKSWVVKALLFFIIIVLTLYNAHIILTYKDLVESDECLLKDSVTISRWYIMKQREYMIYLKELFANEEEIIDDLPELRVYIDNTKIKKLNSALPASGREWKKARLVYNNAIYKIKLRYRGDSSYHWYFPKKSYKIKLRDGKKLFNHELIQLINIKSGNLLLEYIGNELAKKFNLLTCEEKYFKVYINDKYAGVYLYLEPLDKAFLEIKNRTEGDIYFGDIVYEDATVGLSNNLFDAVHSWDIRLMREFERKEKKLNLNNLIKTVNKILILNEGYHELNDLVDLNYFQNFSAYTTFIRTWHMDYFHNIILYYDYTTGRFIQVPWDNTAFANRNIQPDWVPNDLFLALHKDPKFYTNKLKILHQFIAEEDGINQTLQLVNETLIRIDNASRCDKFNGRAPARIPLTRDEYQKQNERVIQEIIKNNGYLDIIVNVNVSYCETRATNFIKLDIGVSGWSSVVLESIQLGGSCNTVNPLIIRDFNLNGENDDLAEFRPSTPLYSGRIHPSRDSDIAFIGAFGGPQYPFLYPSAHVYTFFINSTNPNCRIEKINARNLLTGEPVNVTQVFEPLKEDPDLFSIHPWRLELDEQTYLDNKRKDIIKNYPQFDLTDNVLTIGPGRFNIDKTIILPRKTITYIQPGTELVMHSNVSIISFGTVIAKGTREEPIQVYSLNKSQPWHVFALANEDAENSSFRYVEFSDGYEAFIEGIYFSGMFNAYHTNNVFVDHCIFMNAHADDALNFKYSNSRVTNSQFINNSADAIDFDFMAGEITGNYFINNGNDAIDTSGSTTLVQNNYVRHSGDKCISYGENSNTISINNVLDGCKIGVEVKDLSRPVIRNTIIINNNVGVNIYQKKDFFGPAHPIFEDCIFLNNGRDVTFENTFEGRKLETDTSKVSIKNSFIDYEGENNLNYEISINDLASNNWSIDNLGLIDSSQIPMLQ